MDRWVEAADWIVWQLCGEYVRNACSAGYKGILQDGRYPSRDYLAEVDPAFVDFVDTKLDQPIGRLGDRAGSLTAEMAARLGLAEGIAVAVGNVDAHVTAPAARAVGPGQLVAIMGTSTCHVVNGEHAARGARHVRCRRRRDRGRAVGLRGRSERCRRSVRLVRRHRRARGVPRRAPHDAGSASTTTSRCSARRRPSVSTVCSPSIGTTATARCSSTTSCPASCVGLTVTTRPEDVYRALMEATAFGARTIVETLTASGVPVDEYIVAGGLTKNPVLMQIYADVLRLPLSVIGSEQGPALGSAIHAAVAAGAHPDVPAAADGDGSRAPRRVRAERR